PVHKTHCEKIDGYKVYVVKSCGKFDSLFFKYVYSRRIYKILKKETPDFVYQRVLKFVSYYIASFQIQLGYKHLIHISDLFTIDFRISSLRDRISFYFFRKTLKKKPRFIVQTNEQKTILARYNIEPALQVYNMHPLPEFDVNIAVTRKIREKVKHIVWVANIRPIKGFDILAEVISQLKGFNIKFDTIGDVQDTAYAQPILDKIKNESIVTHYTGKNNVFVNKFIEDEAFLVINTSKSEGFSNVFIQSWLRGVPVISLNSNPDSLFDTNKEFGIYCEGLIEMMTDGISELINNPY